MSIQSLAFNRFGLGARSDDAAPEDPRRWLLAQLDRFDPRPEPIAAAPARTQVATQLADYLEEVRMAGGPQRRAAALGQAPGEAGTGQGPGFRRRLAMQAAAGQPAAAPQPAMDMQAQATTPVEPGARPGMDDQLAGLPDNARRFIRGVSRENYLAMVGARTNAALVAPAPFVERLVHFWANHFAVSADKLPVIGMAGLLEFEAIRPHVLGKFVDMLIAVERHPAMLLYLDQAQSIGPNSRAGQLAARFARQRRGLNENLAREILELHTLGVNSGYSQADVTEFARVLTGWTVDGLVRGPMQRFLGGNGRPGGFHFAEALHEPGTRSVAGRTYAQDGEAQGLAVLGDLAADPRTARHLATKLARHFAGDEPPPAMIARLSEAYLHSGGDLPTVYRAILDSPEAWSAATPKFRSPWDWTVAALRAVGTRHVEPQPAAGLLIQLGQPIWRPGSPAGFDDIGPSWSGPDALLRRVEAAERIAARSGGQIDARQLAPRLLPGALGEATAQAIARAESPSQGLALLLVSPEFLRR
ncbi:MAG: DUF1800 domain-containing protein [Sphingomonadaceae bacterium]|nr:DUF1800 domain-containing protein [Sphingomonadaceae bacterium]